MQGQNKAFESPLWAGRVLRGVALLSFLLLLATTIPAWRQPLILVLGVSFGLFWGLFGLLTYLFDWALPLRGGGFASPINLRWLWLIFSMGAVILGSCCVFFSLRPLITR